MASIGLMFGSFNPPHSGHLLLVEEALKKAFCDEVWLMLQLTNPFKEVAWPISADHRMHMLRLLCSGNKRLSAHVTSASRISVTLSSLNQAYPGVKFGLIMGGDLAKGFKSWEDYGELSKFELFSAPRFKLASSLKIKQLIKAGKPITGLVPKPIEKYIQQNNLYQEK